MVMMKKAPLILIGMTLSLTGCVNEPPEADPPSTETGEWYKIIKTDTLPNTLITETVIGNRMYLGYDLVRISFLYSSGPDSTILSGCLCWPLKSDTCSELWLENHITALRWNECPTQSVMPGMLHSSLRRAVYVGADYQGSGLSREMERPYFNTPLIASQSIDCLKAAMTIMRDNNMTLHNNFYTYNLGYSLGGAVSLGVAREIEKNPGLKEKIHLKKSFCGGGPYNQTVLFAKFLAMPNEPLEYPVEFICGLLSILYSSPSFSEQFTKQELFTDKILSSGILESLESKEYNTVQLNRMLENAGCITLETLLSHELIDPKSDMHAALMRELDKLDLTSGWFPSIPVLFYHSRSDMTVPIECIESVMTRMKDNPDIEYVLVDSYNHTQAGKSFYTNLIYGLFKLN